MSGTGRKAASSVLASSGSTASRAIADRGTSGLRTEDFFKLLVTELKQQNPFEPAKTADLIGQVSQIRSIELSKNLTDVLSQIAGQQRTLGAGELLGKYVTAVTTASDGTQQQVSGLVTSLRFESDGTAMLELDNGQCVRVADVILVTTSENAPGQAAASDESADSDQAADKLSDQGKSSSGGLLPWLSLDASLHL